MFPASVAIYSCIIARPTIVKNWYCTQLTISSMLVAIGSTILLALLWRSNKSCFCWSVNWETLRCTAVNTSRQSTGKVNTLDNIVPTQPKVQMPKYWIVCLFKNLRNCNHRDYIIITHNHTGQYYFPQNYVMYVPCNPFAYLCAHNLTKYSQTHAWQN